MAEPYRRDRRESRQEARTAPEQSTGYRNAIAAAILRDRETGIGVKVEESRVELKAQSSADADFKAAFLHYLRLFAPDLPTPVIDHKFHPDRKYHIDLAYPDLKVGVELDGTVHIKYQEKWERDEWRSCELAGLGWRVCRVTSRMLTDDPEGIIKLLRKALEYGR